MNFFEMPELPPEPKEPPRPRWSGPPTNEIGGAVPGDVVLVKGPDVAVVVRHITAYQDGVSFVLDIWARKTIEGDDPFEPPHRVRFRRGHDMSDVLRFGIQFSDGRKATTLDFWDPSGSEEAPDRPVLMPRGGGGGGRHWSQQYWLWPLPPEGPLAFVCEWPAKDIPLTRREVDGGVVRSAASKAEVLWEEQREEEGAGYWSVMMSSSETATAVSEEAPDEGGS